jgi:hypothetical protein
LWPEASAAERAAAPASCRGAAALWAEALGAVIARDGVGAEDGTRSIATYVAACMAMNDVREGARTEAGRCSTRDRRMTGDARAPILFVPEGEGEVTAQATRAAEIRLAALAPDSAPRGEARAALEAVGFACDPEAAERMACLFSHRELAYAAREPTLFASVFWSLELALDAGGRVDGRRLGVTLVHP